MSYYAVDLRGPSKGRKPPGRKREAVSYDPLQQGAKMLADHLFEGASKLADILAPDRPADTEELPPQMQWAILERAALIVGPHMWEDPDAIEDLLRLRKEFIPALAERTAYLKSIARLRRVEKQGLPDLNITPASPEWERRNK